MNRKAVITIVSVIVVLFLGFLIFKGKKSQLEARQTPISLEAQQLYAKAESFKRDRDLLKAKDVYQQILTNYPDFDKVEEIQKQAEVLSLEIIFSNIQTPQTVVHEVQPGDSIAKLAKQYGTTAELIKRSNYLKNDVIRVGQKLRIWTGKFNIFVDKSQNILILKDNNEVVRVYSVSTGANNSTPVGKFKITSKLVDPVWFNRGAVVPPESPENVLGSRWLGFDLPGYGIHGTVEPETIGKQVTAGCVRMRNEDVEELYSLVTIGSEVEIVD